MPTLKSGWLHNKRKKQMLVDYYQARAMEFRLGTADETYALLNLSGEVGELMSTIAKFIRDGGDIEQHHTDVKKELGDILWMVAAVAKDYNLSMSDICKSNILKLESRKSRDTIQGSGNDR